MHSIIARKRFGQNFLQDTQIIQAIIQAIYPKPEDNLVEIGPGRGALTRPMLTYIDQLTAIEIDRDLIAYLQTQFNPEKLHLIEADALTVDYACITTKKLRVYGNLPYNVATPLLLHLLSFIQCIQDGHFMVQKEVAERIIASPGNKNYGRLSVIMQYFCQTEILFLVPPEAFYPKPKVDSAIIRLIPHAQSPYSVIHAEQLVSAVKTAFAHRRKTLKNNFKGLLTEQDWQKLNIDGQQRPEQLDIHAFIDIARFIHTSVLQSHAIIKV